MNTDSHCFYSGNVSRLGPQLALCTPAEKSSDWSNTSKGTSTNIGQRLRVSQTEPWDIKLQTILRRTFTIMTELPRLPVYFHTQDYLLLKQAIASLSKHYVIKENWGNGVKALCMYSVQRSSQLYVLAVLFRVIGPTGQETGWVWTQWWKKNSLVLPRNKHWAFGLCERATVLVHVNVRWLTICVRSALVMPLPSQHVVLTHFNRWQLCFRHWVIQRSGIRTGVCVPPEISENLLEVHKI